MILPIKVSVEPQEPNIEVPLDVRRLPVAISPGHGYDCEFTVLDTEKPGSAVNYKLSGTRLARPLTVEMVDMIDLDYLERLRDELTRVLIAHGRDAPPAWEG